MLAEVNSQIMLVVSEDPETRSYLEMALRCEGFAVEVTEDDGEALRLLQSGGPLCAVLLDMSLSKRDGLQVLRDIRELERHLPVIAMSGNPSSGAVVEIMRAGANDFLTKPVSPDGLSRALSNVFAGPSIEALRPEPTVSLNEAYLGASPNIRAIHKLLPPIAWSEAPILIQGETGVGKEVLARQIHSLSRRAHKPFFKLNCAALPSELVESELFGYERGAFTGAFQRKPGMFELADSGTLLLDEIGDMDFKLQAKLLQVLQDHEFQRLGGKETVRVDVRVIAATHNDLERAIALDKFRQDLYYRLNVVSLYVPPLRELREDIVPLAEFLLKKHCGEQIPEITSQLRQALLAHDWPGNVRELENVIRKFAILRNADAIARDLTTRATRRTLMLAPDLTPKSAPKPVAPPILEQVTQAKHQAETDAILAALNSMRWNRKKAAALLKIDYKALLYKMKKLGINAADREAHMSGEPVTAAASPEA
ncbi:MAG: sigma-54-dependent Fis family transcriptional regulator [Bryobacterales bacterium]|nr:sigma-54-dependent Fis family transcriptional regulator [Bryobacterales bacterium]MBV9400205.1 sigma-54-dependent Fis family transcriptional regulator [Bryobacterales bacterium]